MRIVQAFCLVFCLLGVGGQVALEGCGSSLNDFGRCLDNQTIWVCQVVIYGGSFCGCGAKTVVQPTCATSETQAENYVFKYLMMKYPGASQFNIGCQNTGNTYAQSVEPPIKIQGTSGAGGGDACTCNAGGGSPGAGGSYGDGVGGSSDVGGVGPVGAGGFTTADVGAGTTAADVGAGAGSAEAPRGRGGAGGAW